MTIIDKIKTIISDTKDEAFLMESLKACIGDYERDKLAEVEKDITTPILVGYLNKKFGYQQYEPIEIGTPVYETRDRYFFKMKLIRKGITHIHRQNFYKETLKPCIDFINT